MGKLSKTSSRNLITGSNTHIMLIVPGKCSYPWFYSFFCGRENLGITRQHSFQAENFFHPLKAARACWDEDYGGGGRRRCSSPCYLVEFNKRLKTERARAGGITSAPNRRNLQKLTSRP